MMYKGDEGGHFFAASPVELKEGLHRDDSKFLVTK
jgi:hypothetical protein